MKRKPVPAAGIVGEVALREAAATEFGQMMQLVRAAVQRVDPSIWNFVAFYGDRVIVCNGDGRQYAYPYTIDDNNQVTLGTPYEVVSQHVPATAMREAAPNNPMTTGGGAHKERREDGRESPAILPGGVFLEALDAGDDDKPARYLVRVIKAGTSLNGFIYSPAVLREAAPLFDGVRVFVKGDVEHLKGGGKDFRQLVGRLGDSRYVEANGGEIQAVLDVLESSDVAPKLREAVQRGMTDLFGLSIDATGPFKKTGKFREAIKIRKVDSVDLIIEPGAGGQVIRFAEAHQETDTMLRQQMINDIAARDPKRAEGLADASDEAVLTAYREAVAAPAQGERSTGLTAEEVQQQIRMVEARADARVAIAGSKLPAPVQERLTQRFAEAASFNAQDVATAIEEERKFLGRLVEGAQVRGLGEGIEMGEGRAEKVGAMLDDFFDRSKRSMSFRECYIEITGDRGVTGLLQNMDIQRLREAAGEQNFREAVSANTFSNILGDSITRAMVREYANLETSNDWRWLVDVVPVNDFRTQERVRMGGYGNLPAVAERGNYTALTSPGDEKATYAITKRGGTESVSLEAIANDDVGVIRRIPLKMAGAAGRTLYEFVYGFLDSNAAIYDGKALFIADHKNLGTAALANASFAAARLAIKQQTELSSNKRLGLTLRHLVVPSELEETAFDMFVRGTNLDETFVQSRKPTVHVVDHWTDTNNWYATADTTSTPLIELGFFGGNENPELFVQDTPTGGSVFSNDVITYKIRHIYSGAVLDYRGFYGALVADP